MSQLVATVCIQAPTRDRNCPAKKIRNAGCRSARNAMAMGPPGWRRGLGSRLEAGELRPELFQCRAECGDATALLRDHGCRRTLDKTRVGEFGACLGQF